MTEYNFAGTPSVTSLGLIDSGNTSVFTLNCTSTDSPATTVIWTKGGEVLSEDAVYQILRDRETSTYDNFLVINNSTPDELVDIYTCSVLNSVGISNMESVNIQGMLYTIDIAKNTNFSTGSHNTLPSTCSGQAYSTCTTLQPIRFCMHTLSPR